MSPQRTTTPRILVTVTGPDHPGITAAMTTILAQNQTEILDIEQVVVQGRLNLSILITGDRNNSSEVLKDLLFAAKEHQNDLDFQVVDVERTLSTRAQYVLTVLGDPTLEAKAVSGISHVLARHETNIEKIEKLSESSFATLEMTISVPDESRVRLLRAELVRTASDLEVDVALQAEGLFRRAKRLIVFDLDSTLVRGELIDKLGERHGIGDRIAGVTRRAMNGEIDFATSLRERVALLAGLPERVVVEVAVAAEIMPGAKELVECLHRLGFKTAIVSGGFQPAAEALRRRLGMDWAHANRIEIQDAKLTGRVEEPILDSQAKARIVRELAKQSGISLDQVIAVGDGANDLPMLEVAGLGIAFNAHAVVREQARHQLNRPRLDSILFLLGISEKDIRSLQEKRS